MTSPNQSTSESTGDATNPSTQTNTHNSGSNGNGSVSVANNNGGGLLEPADVLKALQEKSKNELAAKAAALAANSGKAATPRVIITDSAEQQAEQDLLVQEDEIDEALSTATSTLLSRQCSNPASWIGTYLRYTKNLESPQLFQIWAAISSIAAVLRRNVWISHGYYNIYPNLYTIIVAPSGEVRKSTAMELACDEFVRHIPECNVISGTSTSSGLYDALLNPYTVDGNQFNPNGCGYLLASELTHTFYEGSERDRILKMLTDLYGGKSSDSLTRKDGRKNIKSICINFVACTTPRSLTEVIKSSTIGVGWIGRVMWVYSDVRRRKEGWPEKDKEIDALQKSLRRDLLIISKLKGEIVPTPEAKAFFKHWYENELPSANSTDNVYMKEYLPRKGTHVLKLAQIMVVDEGNNLTLHVRHIKRAMDILELVERHMLHAFKYIGSDTSALSGDIVVALFTKDNYSASEAQLLTIFRNRIKKKEELAAAIEMLVDEGLVIKQFRADVKKYVYRLSAPAIAIMTDQKTRAGEMKLEEMIDRHGSGSGSGSGGGNK